MRRFFKQAAVKVLRHQNVIQLILSAFLHIIFGLRNLVTQS